MIELKIEDYCHNCGEFEPCKVSPAVYFNDNKKVVFGNTEVRCTYADRCAHVYEYLENRKNREKMLEEY